MEEFDGETAGLARTYVASCTIMHVLAISCTTDDTLQFEFLTTKWISFSLPRTKVRQDCARPGFVCIMSFQAGLAIRAGQRTMSGLTVDLNGQTFVLPVKFNHIENEINLRFLLSIVSVVIYRVAVYCGTLI